MFTAATVLAAVLAASPTHQPPPVATAHEYTDQQGHRVRWASVAYSLPDGQSAEVVIVADDTASGEGYLFVDGEAIAHSSYDDANGLVSWTSSEPGTGELAAAALAGLSGDAADEGPEGGQVHLGIRGGGWWCGLLCLEWRLRLLPVRCRELGAD